MSTPRLLLTGASGLVGPAAARILARDGFEVRLMRHRGAVPDGFAVVEGGLDDLPDLVDIDVVVHAAAALGGDDAHLWRVNVEGSERLFRAAAAAGVERVVYVSSAGVYASEDTLGMTEEHPVGSDHAYCRSKFEGEERGREILGDRLTVLRPVTIYSTGPCPVFVALGRLLAANHPVPHNGGADTPADMVHVDDLAEAIALAAQGRGAGGVFNIAGPEPAPFRAMVDAMAARMGLTPNWQPADSGAPFEPVTVMAAMTPHTVSIDRARRELGYAPRRSVIDEIGRAHLASP